MVFIAQFLEIKAYSDISDKNTSLLFDGIRKNLV